MTMSSVAGFLMLMLAVLAGAGSRPAYAAPPPPPGSQQTRPVTAPTKKEPVQLLIPATPSGPAPTGFVIAGTPLVARLKWNAAPGAASYSVLRAAGSAAPIAIAQGLRATQLGDVVPDPRPVYRYRLIVNYSNGTFGEAVASWTSPPLAQPSGLQATLTGPQTVQLRWNAAAGAVGYRVDGAGIANTGL